MLKKRKKKQRKIDRKGKERKIQLLSHILPITHFANKAKNISFATRLLAKRDF